MHDRQSIHIHTTRGHTRPAGNISNPNPRACTTRSQYIYIPPAGIHDPPSIHTHTTRAHAQPAVTINIYPYKPPVYATRSSLPYHPLLRRPTTVGIFLAGSTRHSA